MVVQTGKIEIEASLWYPSAVLVMPVIDMPCDNRCRHRGARCCARYRCAHCGTRHCHAHYYALSYVLVVALSIVFYRRVPSWYRCAHRRICSRCHWKHEDGYLVEGSN